MTAIAGTAEYQREYQRRRQRGLSTRGLAEAMRAGLLEPPVSAEVRVSVELAITRGRWTSELMVMFGLTYEQVATIRDGME